MKIVNYPHPSLRHVARPLTAIDKKVHLQVGEMLSLMYEAKGLGLAGPQVCFPFQLLVMNPSADPNQRDQEGVYINPIVLETKGSVEGEEGCLSFPGLFRKVRRPKAVKVRAYNLKAEVIEVEAVELPARILHHEIDHLHGVLFIDKMGPVAKLSSRSALKDLEREYRKAQEKGEIPPDSEIEKWLTGLENESDGIQESKSKSPG